VDIPASADASGSFTPVAVSDDNTTLVEYSVKIYYTAEVEADTADLEGFIQLIIAETNQGYINSNIPLRVKSHCPEKVTSIIESGNMEYLLEDLTNLNNDLAVTRDGADVAALIALYADGCGLAWFDALANGQTFSITKKSCATGYYSFGHEIGHNIGATHDPYAGSNNVFPYGHGHLIEAGAASTGLRTIMGYARTGHDTRVNWWSNPDVIHPETLTPTGVVGLSNNAAVLTMRRFELAMIGDESICRGTATVGPPTTTEPPVTNPPATVGPPVTSGPPATAGPPVTSGPPATAGPPVTRGPPAPGAGTIKCEEVTTTERPLKKMKNVTCEACETMCQNNYKKGCVAINYEKKTKTCELVKLHVKKSTGYFLLPCDHSSGN
jgi:hypothetical protein